MATRTEQGTPGVKQFAGVINEEWDRRLRQQSVMRDTLKEMQTDPTVSASLKAIDALARSTDYQLDPAPDADASVLEFVEDCFDQMDGAWGDKLSEILSMVVYGFSLFEVVYVQRPDGMIGWKRWAPRGQETVEQWVFDDAGRDWTAVVQRNPNTYAAVTIPRQYLLHFVTVSRKQSPEGESLIRPAFEPWYKKKHIQNIEAIGIERDYTGWPHLKVPQDVWDDPGLLSQWQDSIRSMRVGDEAGIITPSTVDENGVEHYSFQVVSSAGTRPINTDVVVARYQRDIMRNLLVDWLMLGDEGGGSFALGVSKAEIFGSFVQSLLDSIADTITQYAIKPLLVANGISVDDAPTFRFEPIVKKDVAAVLTSLAEMIKVGAVDPQRVEVQTMIYELFNLPIPDGGFNEPEPVQQRAPEQDNPVDDDEAVATTDEREREPVTFTEPLPADWKEQARKAWDDVVPEKFVGLLDAKVEAA